MTLLLILFTPFIFGLILLFLKNAMTSRIIALASSSLSLFYTIALLFYGTPITFTMPQSSYLGIPLSLGYDGIGLLMLVLSNLLFPFIILAGFKQKQQQVPVLNALILLTQFALAGVFLAQNAFLFYVFWELALIPVYFILLLWGGEGRNTITLKFFIYTLAGSLILLFGIIYLYQLTPAPHSTDFSAFSQLHIPVKHQLWLFWILFIAFAIKMPVFPFHTWQPSTYTMAPPQGVMILAGVMTKMGIYGALRFLFPIVPLGVQYWQHVIIILSITGVIYASVIAFRQANFKKLIAFSSMAHISLMCAAMFVLNEYAIKGMLFQVIGHGISIVALFYLASIVEEKTGTLELPALGGLRLSTPNMALLLLMVVFGSIALPMTAGFIGEFLMITGLFKYSVWVAALGGTTMILGAVYMLYAYQRAMLGDIKPGSIKPSDIGTIDYIILIPLLIIIIGLGIFPQPVFDLLGIAGKSLQDIFSPIAHAFPAITH